MRPASPRPLEHLTPGDLALLADLAGVSALRPEPALVAELLLSPRLPERVFRPVDPADGLLHVSPFLVFAAALGGAADVIRRRAFVEDWVGPRQRVPVFDVEPLRALVADPAARLGLAELLASYTHVVSGTTWVPTRRGWQRHRYSELDPVQLASLLEVVDEAERPGVYRRLGDLALFMTGVFPDHVGGVGLRPVQRERLGRLGLTPRDDELDGMALWEDLGRRCYRAAGTDLGARFVDARRVLNVAVDAHLFPLRDRWFGN